MKINNLDTLNPLVVANFIQENLSKYQNFIHLGVDEIKSLIPEWLEAGANGDLGKRPWADRTIELQRYYINKYFRGFHDIYD